MGCAPFTLQVQCIMKRLDSQLVDERDPSSRGIYLRTREGGDMAVARVEWSRLETRAQDINHVLPCVVSSLAAGDCVYVHCITGVSRGGYVAAVLGAVATGLRESCMEYYWRVNALRHLKVEGEGGRFARRPRYHRGQREDNGEQGMKQLEGLWV